MYLTSIEIVTKQKKKKEIKMIEQEQQLCIESQKLFKPMIKVIIIVVGLFVQRVMLIPLQYQELITLLENKITLAR